MNAELRERVRAAYTDLRAVRQRSGCDFCTAALAIGRVARASGRRGLLT